MRAPGPRRSPAAPRGGRHVPGRVRATAGQLVSGRERPGAGQGGSYGVEVIWQLPMAEPTVAVSFDDGPYLHYTPKVLRALKRRGVPATFFTIGIHAHAYADLVRRARDEGHEIGNHTWSHPDLSQVTQREADWQLSRTHDVLGKVAGQPPALFRPAYGKVDCV